MMQWRPVLQLVSGAFDVTPTTSDWDVGSRQTSFTSRSLLTRCKKPILRTSFTCHLSGNGSTTLCLSVHLSVLSHQLDTSIRSHWPMNSSALHAKGAYKNVCNFSMKNMRPSLHTKGQRALEFKVLPGSLQFVQHTL